jgi:release factor glutamine methyltransferase
MNSRTATSGPPETQDGDHPLTRRQLLADCTALLRLAGIPNAVQEAGWLIEAGLGLSTLKLRVHPDVAVSRSDYECVMSLCRRRARREPLQYLVGTQEFCGLEFVVEPGVLIPRPETELLVDEVVRHCNGLESPLILEIGTGSGCIAVSLATRLSQAQVHATDISWTAIRIAARNAARHRVTGRTRFVVTDLFKGFSTTLQGRVTVIVSNPPYIPDGHLDRLQPEVRFEPSLALAGGRHGLDFHRRLVVEAAILLGPGGLLTMEVGQSQATQVTSNIEATRRYNAPRIRVDGAGIDRVISAKRIE